jgi:hypothetical protein
MAGGYIMTSRKLWIVSLSLASLAFATTAQAIIVCFDYALHRAGRFAGAGNCDPNPFGVSKYLNARDLKERLRLLGYELVSGPDPIGFGNNMFNTPGFAEEFLRPNDVIFLRDEHVGFVGGIDFGTSPSTPLIDHYIQIPGETGKGHPFYDLPKNTITQINGSDVHAGYWDHDPVQEFLHRRTFAQGGGVEVWRRTGVTDPTAPQMACRIPGLPSELALRLKTAGATCEVKWTIGKSGQAQKAYCRSMIDGPPAPDSAQLNVGADGSGPGATAEATWD